MLTNFSRQQYQHYFVPNNILFYFGFVFSIVLFTVAQSVKPKIQMKMWPKTHQANILYIHNFACRKLKNFKFHKYAKKQINVDEIINLRCTIKTVMKAIISLDSS